MSEVHQLIFRHGVEGARTMAGTKAERHAIDAAALILAEEESRLGITHAGFAMTSLPHKRISGNEKGTAQLFWSNPAETDMVSLWASRMALLPD